MILFENRIYFCEVNLTFVRLTCRLGANYLVFIHLVYPNKNEQRENLERDKTVRIAAVTL